MHCVPHGNHCISTLVAGYALGHLLHREAEAGPFVVDEGFVAGAEAAAPVDLDEDLVRFGVQDVDLRYQSRDARRHSVSRGYSSWPWWGHCSQQGTNCRLGLVRKFQE